jgi:DNA-binding NarL/FixJ family response regulator
VSTQSSTRPLQILLVEDHPLTLLGVRHLIDQAEWPLFQNVEITESTTAREALNAMRSQVFDVAVLDFYLPDGGGLDLLQHMRALQPDMRVLFFSASAPRLSRAAFLELGARGYVSKTAAPQNLVEAILAVYYGGVYFPAEELPGFEDSAAETLSEPAPKLSQRETQVLKMLAEDCSKHDIAAELHISVRTVETYRARLMKKLNCRSLVGLIHYALEQGMVKL